MKITTSFALSALLAIGCGGDATVQDDDHAESAGGEHGDAHSHSHDDGHHDHADGHGHGPGEGHAHHHADGEQGEGHHGEGEGHAEGVPEVTRTLEDGSQLFGAEMEAQREAIELATILATPSAYDGQVVLTQGEISQVCQQMGCWMEIRTDANTPGIRVPMANHAFYLPRDVAGRRATLQGTVVVQALGEEEREHLESEGATATGSDLSIEATSVIVHP